ATGPHRLSLRIGRSIPHAGPVGQLHPTVSGDLQPPFRLPRAAALVRMALLDDLPLAGDLLDHGHIDGLRLRVPEFDREGGLEGLLAESLERRLSRPGGDVEGATEFEPQGLPLRRVVDPVLAEEQEVAGAVATIDADDTLRHRQAEPRRPGIFDAQTDDRTCPPRFAGAMVVHLVEADKAVLL